MFGAVLDGSLVIRDLQFDAGDGPEGPGAPPRCGGHALPYAASKGWPGD